MNIGEVSALSGLSSKMIRRYEEAGIIPRSQRSSKGYRVYTEKDLNILKFIKRGRELGFSMKDLKELVSLWKNKTRSSSLVRKIAVKHKTELELKLKEVQGMLNTINDLIQSCHGDDRPDCPILDELDCH